MRPIELDWKLMEDRQIIKAKISVGFNKSFFGTSVVSIFKSITDSMIYEIATEVRYCFNEDD